jgi:signal transduction histidine kinase
MRLEGPLDTALTGEIVEQLVPVLRESLTNVAKHARAASVVVRVEVFEGIVELEVIDDGVGLPEELRPNGMGVGNIHERAALLGGEAQLASVPWGGVRVFWRVPL